MKVSCSSKFSGTPHTETQQREHYCFAAEIGSTFSDTLFHKEFSKIPNRLPNIWASDYPLQTYFSLLCLRITRESTVKA